jgi:single-strand DNA-binding protein
VANDLNQCSFLGRLGKDPTVRYMPSGDAVANFSIAVGSTWKDKATGDKKESTEWVNVTAFGKLAEICAEYLAKGSQVFIQGRFKTDKYDKDGQTHYSTKIIADRMQMLGGRSGGERQEPEPSNGGGASRSIPDFDDGFADQDIPF